MNAILEIGFWPFVFVGLALGGAAFRTVLRTRRLPRGSPICSACGYSRVGLRPESTCPECGGAPTLASMASAHAASPSLHLAVIVSCLLACPLTLLPFVFLERSTLVAIPFISPPYIALAIYANLALRRFKPGRVIVQVVAGLGPAVLIYVLIFVSTFFYSEPDGQAGLVFIIAWLPASAATGVGLFVAVMLTRIVDRKAG